MESIVKKINIKNKINPKLILEASSIPGKANNGDSIVYHSLTISQKALTQLSEEEIKNNLYEWFKIKNK